MTSTDGSITEYVCVYGNSGNFQEQRKERLINSGFYDIATAYQSVHVNYWNRRVPNGTHGGVRGRRLVTASYSIFLSVYPFVSPEKQGYRSGTCASSNCGSHIVDFYVPVQIGKLCFYIQMKENFRFYLRCFYCITKVVILQFNSENRTELARNGWKSV